MEVFVIGISGAVGGLLAAELTGRGDVVSGLVRREDQRAGLASRDVEARVGDTGTMTADQPASVLSGVDAVVYTAGSNGGSRDVTDAVDSSLSHLDWLVLRPSVLVDRAGTGRGALGPAQPHDEIAREDVAATLAELLHEARISRQILEVDQGETPIASAVRANVR